MLPILSLCLIAFAVSLDGFGVGVMYGLRKIRIPLLSVAIISCCSGIIIFGSMQIGVLISRFLSPDTARAIGACIMIGIGIWAIIQMLRQKNDGQELSGSDYPAVLPANELQFPSGRSHTEEQRTVLQIELKRMGIVIRILKTPALADMDRSGIISASEATFLGIALSLDAFGAGIGAALIGFSPLVTSAVIAFASGLFILSGLRIGFIFSGMRWLHRFSFVPGCILIIMGIMKLF